MISKKDFQINWPHPKEDNYLSANSSKRLWSDQMDRNLCEELKKPWIAYVNRLSNDIPFFIWLTDVSFFIWLTNFASRHAIQDDVYTLSRNVQSARYKSLAS